MRAPRDPLAALLALAGAAFAWAAEASEAEPIPGRPRPVQSLFGGRPACSFSYRTQLFQPEAVAAAEEGVRKWLLTAEASLEAFHDEELEENKKKDHREAWGRAWSRLDPLQRRFRHILPPVGPACPEVSFLGRGQHGNGKHVCGLSALPPRRPDARGAGLGDSCVVLSLGSGNNWDFERGVHANTSCVIHTFDCTVDGEVPAYMRRRVFFHRICAGRKDTLFAQEEGLPESLALKPYHGILSYLGLDSAPDVVKVDIDGAEFDFMRRIRIDLEVDPSKERLLPRQIVMAIHHTVHRGGVGQRIFGWGSRGKTSGELLAFALQMYALGYRLSHVDWETTSPFALEVIFSRVFC